MSARTLTGALLAATTLTGCGGGGGNGPRAPAPEDTGISGQADAGTGAVETVRGDDTRFVASVQEMLQGQVAGLEVTEDAACGGIVLRIRGHTPSLMGGSCGSQPLLIIDGKPVAPGNAYGTLAALLPTDIDRIQVLKDVASTSIYGMRGAYGVVLIWTTK